MIYRTNHDYGQIWHKVLWQKTNKYNNLNNSLEKKEATYKWFLQ